MRLEWLKFSIKKYMKNQNLTAARKIVRRLSLNEQLLRHRNSELNNARIFIFKNNVALGAIKPRRDHKTSILNPALKLFFIM